MAFTLDRFQGFPARAGSAVNPRTAVRLAPGSGERVVIPVTAVDQFPFGVNGRATAVPSQVLTVREQPAVVEAVAAASLGAGAPVGHATANGALGPVAPASGSVVCQVGESLEPAAPGEVFSVYVRPRQLSDGGAV